MEHSGLNLLQNFSYKGNNFRKGKFQVQLLISGVGSTMTAYHLGRYFAKNKPELCINAGVAGAFTEELKIGDVVNVISDRFGDLGAEEQDGSFIDVHQMGLIKGNEAPFQNGNLYNMPAMENDFLPKVSGITVNKVHGHEESIQKIKDRYSPEVESMEGAAFFYACLTEKINFLQIRSISNHVEPRCKDNWDIPLAIENLNKVLIELVDLLAGGILGGK